MELSALREWSPAMISNEFHRILTKLALPAFGLNLISHAEEAEPDTCSRKHTRTVRKPPEKARKIVLGMAELLRFCSVEVRPGVQGEWLIHRMIWTKPSPYYEAVSQGR